MSDYTLTPNYSLYKPTVNADGDQWGNHWNINADTLDATLKQHGDGLSGGPFLPLATGGTVAGPVTAPLSTSTAIATGSMASRTIANRFADVVNVRDFGAVFDGNSHPLSAYYPTLAAAQAVYPHAVALTDEIDGVAVQAAINLCQSRVTNYSYGGTVMLPNGNGRINQPLSISKQNVSLESAGAEFLVNSNVARSTPSAPTRLTWTGAARTAGQFQVNMLTVAPIDGLRLLSGTNVRGILFYCGGIAGAAGPLIASTRRARIECSTYEPAGIPYTGATLTAGSTTVTVSSTAGLRLGESVVSTNLPGGAYVASITDATHFNASMQAIASATETVTIGGEGIRFDVVDSLQDSNDTQFLRVRFAGVALLGAAFATAPLVFIGGSGVVGGSGGTHFGNTSLNWFDDIDLLYNNGHGVVCNNSDHNFHDSLIGQKIGAGAGRLLICNGTLDANNGGARWHIFNHTGDAGLYAGTNTGGFTSAAIGCRVLFLDRQNAGVLPTLGVGATAFVQADNQSVLTWTGGVQPLVAQYPDATIAGGNSRGNLSVDLQLLRTAATQVAAGQQSTISGGENNTITSVAQDATIIGGSGNSASGIGSTVLGGAGNSASQYCSVAMGTNAVADLYGLVAHSAGTISSGRRGQNNKQILKGVSAANTTPVRLTADGLAASAINVVNMPSTSQHQCSALTVLLSATDSTNSANSYSWCQTLGLLKRSGAASTTTYTPLGTPVSGGVGTIAGIAVTEAADTTNGGYSLTFTPPTGNAVIWRVVATVEWTRVDGA
jgi:hypothetical protein